RLGRQGWRRTWRDAVRDRLVRLRRDERNMQSLLCGSAFPGGPFPAWEHRSLGGTFLHPLGRSTAPRENPVKAAPNPMGRGVQYSNLRRAGDSAKIIWIARGPVVERHHLEARGA